ncbi:MAG: 3-deoxy-7-phosphoheptulonate synthase [Acidobacteriota bacterium]
MSRKMRTDPRSPRFTARETRPEGSIVRVGNQSIGGPRVVVIAGPCAVESEDQIVAAARAVKASGARLLRGGAYKPRSSPYTFQGLRREGLDLLARAREATGLGVVTEVMDARHLEDVCRVADVLQIGSRNMQNFTLLDEVGACDRPVLLKRGMSATLEELLLAAERVALGGNTRIILCERGIRTFETATRNTLDLNAVPFLKRRTHLPVIVDPSHGTGCWWMVPHLSRAAVAAGSDGLIVEVHPCPEKALSDGAQSLRPEAFGEMMRSLRAVARAVGRKL